MNGCECIPIKLYLQNHVVGGDGGGRADLIRGIEFADSYSRQRKKPDVRPRGSNVAVYSRDNITYCGGKRKYSESRMAWYLGIWPAAPDDFLASHLPALCLSFLISS